MKNLLLSLTSARRGRSLRYRASLLVMILGVTASIMPLEAAAQTRRSGRKAQPVKKKKRVKPTMAAGSGEKGGTPATTIDQSRSVTDMTVRTGESVAPASFDGDVRELPQEITEEERRQYERLRPQGKKPPELPQRVPMPGFELLPPPAPELEVPLAPMPTPLTSFNAMDRNSNGAGWPPDTVGDVGPNHYVQGVNTSVGIYNKVTGAAMATFTFDSLWNGAGTGTPCDTSNTGDPTVIYSPIHDRFIVADFSWTNLQNGPYYECIAVSKTADPVSGGWWLYAVRGDDAAHPWLNDYPKMGIWPDGLYMSANMFDCLNASCSMATYKGARAYALNIAKMVNGQPLIANDVLIVDLDTSHFTLLPSNLRGTPPPAGTPNYFVGESFTVWGWEVYKFHADFVTPANSTFTGPTNVNHIVYASAPSRVSQPSPGLQIDTLADRAMMQNQYRNINGAESLWVNHTTGTATTATPVGIQWGQINVTGGTVSTTLLQSQIFNNGADGLNRFMGSLAVDRQGNMAMGYTAVSTSVAPDIRYVGRLATDPASTLPQTEVTMLPGVTRSVATANNRWGDYSSMSVDPVDDCTFWYTHMYFPVQGSNWVTRIGSFKFPTCGAPTPTPTATPTNTPTATPTNTPTATPTATPVVSGSVLYQNAAAPPVPVPGVSLNAPGSPAVNATTNAGGLYTMTGFAPSTAYTVTPSRTAMVFTSSNGIFANDASLISRHVVGLTTLNANQQLAAAVSGSPTLSSFDAALVARWVVGLTGGTNSTGQWRFTPVNRMYANVNSSQTNQNYTALLMGDVSGDWIASPTRPFVSLPFNSVMVSTPAIEARRGRSITIPLRIENLGKTEVTSFQFDVEYDARVITPAQIAADLAGTFGEGLSVVWNSSVPGLLKVAVYGATPVTGDGTYLNLRFTASSARGPSSPVNITNFRLNDGLQGVMTTAGRVTVK